MGFTPSEFTQPNEHEQLALRREREGETPLGKEIFGLLKQFQSEYRQGADSFSIDGQRYPVYRSTTSLMHLLLRLAHEEGIPIPHRRYDLPSNPVLSVPHEDSMMTGPEERREQTIAGFDHKKGIVFIPDTAFLGISRSRSSLGDKLGEEVFGHALRYAATYSPIRPALTPCEGGKMEKGCVEEFYGFAGRKILHHLLEKHGCPTSLFPSGYVTPPSSALDNEVQTLRARLRSAWFGKDTIKRELQAAEAHQIGYTAGIRFDPSQMPPEKWKSFYTLPTDRAEELFMRERTDYGML